jgi:uncharacterized membrane protein YtjA (UPF0391 family)
MTYFAVVFFVFALVLLTLGFTGIVHGAAGLASVALLLSLFLLAGAAGARLWRDRLEN